MTHGKTTLTALLLGSILMACQGKTTQDGSSNFARAWCISGGPIYTALDQTPQVEAVAIRKGIITYAGPDDGDWCKNYAGANSKAIDLDTAAAYPGLTDAHGHLIGIGLREMTLNLEGTTSIEGLKERLATVVATTPKGETIYGRGWIETHWPENRFPNREDLDAVTTDHPVILERADGHASVVNSLTLAEANITEELYAARGWANIHSMSVDPADIPMLNTLARDGKLGIRVYNSLDILPSKSTQTMSDMTQMQSFENHLVTTRAVKLYADGALGSRGAALLAPYSDDEKNSGLMLLKEEQANAIFDAALRNGTQINTHAIGDRANRMVLDWYEAAFERVPKAQWAEKNPRWRIEHSQIIEPSDIPRTPQEALKMFTIWPAYAAFEENKTGSIEVGKKADLSIFETDLMTASGEDILTSKPLVTMVDGRIIYDAR